MKLLGHIDEINHEGVTGWVADPDHPDEAVLVQIVVDGNVCGEMRASGFREGLKTIAPGATGCYEFKYRFSPALSRTIPHSVEILAGEDRKLVANGRRWLPSAEGGRPELVPVIITSTGRSGTTLLMHDFARRGAFVVADTYPFEVKLASYAAATLKVLTHSTSRTTDEALTFSHLAFRELRAVSIPWNQPSLHRAVGGPQLEQFFRASLPRTLATTFRNMVLDYYGIIGAHQQKTSASYFAEKLTLSQDLRNAVRDVFGEVREIVLVRDPRDYLCSAQSFWKTNLSDSFQTLRSELQIIEKIHQESRADVLFVRYEDLVLDPKTPRAAIDQFLGLQDQEEVPADPEILGKHATTKDPVASVGRWKTELAPEQADACLKHFPYFMSTFGYA